MAAKERIDSKPNLSEVESGIEDGAVPNISANRPDYRSTCAVAFAEMRPVAIERALIQQQRKGFIMDETKALSILSALANGVNPSTGEVFPADSPYQTADVVRALFLATTMLETRCKTRPRGNAAPGNAGKPWSTDEDQRLLADFDRGIPVATLAQNHGRTGAGIQARLEKHGRLQPSSNADGQPRRWRSTGNGAAGGTR